MIFNKKNKFIDIFKCFELNIDNENNYELFCIRYSKRGIK